MKATVIRKDGNFHFLVTDENGKDHWIIQGRFAKDVPTSDGSKVIMEYRDYNWYVTGEDHESCEQSGRIA